MSGLNSSVTKSFASNFGLGGGGGVESKNAAVVLQGDSCGFLADEEGENLGELGGLGSCRLS